MGLGKDRADEELVRIFNEHQILIERYKDYERLWELAEQDNCDGDCDLEPPHKRCPECLAKAGLNKLSEIRGNILNEIEQALNISTS